MSNRRIELYAQKNELVMIDAKRPLTVSIAAEDIKGAISLHPNKCAIARALRREGNVEAFVYRSLAWVDDGKGHLVRYSLPSALQREAHTFDRHGTFEPGKYRLGKNRFNAENQRRYYEDNKEKKKRTRRRRKSKPRVYKIRPTVWECN